MPSPSPFSERWVVPMNHEHLMWLQMELARIVSRLTGEEVVLTLEETRQFVSVWRRGLYRRAMAEIPEASTDHTHHISPAKAGQVCPQESVTLS